MKRIAWVTIFVIIVAGLSLNFGWQALAEYVLSDPAPVQPINFSHKKHATDNGIPCRFCHIYAIKSQVSGVPSVQKCIGCHQSIRRDSPEIQKLYAYWTDREPIPWIKVYDLPDYIYFPHNRHVRGNVECEECHGDVASMERVRRVPHLVMGWCLGCHRAEGRNGPTDCWDCHI